MLATAASEVGVGGAEEGHAEGTAGLGDAQDAEGQLPEAVADHEAGARGDGQQRRPHRVHQPPDERDGAACSRSGVCARQR